MSGAYLPDSPQVTIGGYHHPSLSLDRLYNECTHIRVLADVLEEEEEGKEEEEEEEEGEEESGEGEENKLNFKRMQKD